MGSSLHDFLDERPRRGPCFLCPCDDAGGRPFEVALVRFGHMFRTRGILPGNITPRVGGHPFALEEELDRRRRDAGVYHIASQLVGNTVIMAVQLDMVWLLYTSDAADE